jgi:hypothetical protein
LNWWIHCSQFVDLRVSMFILTEMESSVTKRECFCLDLYLKPTLHSSSLLFNWPAASLLNSTLCVGTP